MLQAAVGLLPIFSMHWVTIQQLYRDTEAGKAGLARGACHDTNFVSWLGAAFLS